MELSSLVSGILVGFAFVVGAATATEKQFGGPCRLYDVQYMCLGEGCSDTGLVCESLEDGTVHTVRGDAAGGDSVRAAVGDGTLVSGVTVMRPGETAGVEFDPLQGLQLLGVTALSEVVDNSGDLVPLSAQRKVFAPMTGDSKLLLVIIDTLDYKVEYSTSKLSSDVFGGPDDRVNVVSIFRGCSSGQLRVYPGVEPGMDAVGTVRVTIPMNLTNAEDDDIINAARVAAQQKLNISLPGTYQNVYYTKAGCYPAKCEFAAYAFVGGYQAMFNGKFIQDAAVQAHEHGHNMGMDHSGTYSRDKGDKTCLMGNPFFKDELGLICFNPAKSWFLDWYPGSYTTFDPASESALYTKLVGAGEWTEGIAGNVTIKVELGEYDLFVGFNRAAGANIENRKYSDEVMVIESKLSRRRAFQSYIEDHLLQEQSYTWGTLTIKVCKIDITVVPGYADVVMYNNNRSNGDCAGSTPFPTPSPTSQPTSQPDPTRRPTTSPTSQPTSQPDPTRRPTTSPTPGPKKKEPFSPEDCVDRPGSFSVTDAGPSDSPTTCRKIHFMWDMTARASLCASTVQPTGEHMIRRCPVACANRVCYSFVGKCRDSSESFEARKKERDCNSVWEEKGDDPELCLSNVRPLSGRLVQDVCPVACQNIKCTCADKEIPFVSVASYNSDTNQEIEPARERRCSQLYGIKQWEYRNLVCLLDIYAITPYFGSTLKVFYMCPKACGFRKECFCRDSTEELQTRRCGDAASYSPKEKRDWCNEKKQPTFFRSCPVVCGVPYCLEEGRPDSTDTLFFFLEGVPTSCSLISAGSAQYKTWACLSMELVRQVQGNVLCPNACEGVTL